MSGSGNSAWKKFTAKAGERGGHSEDNEAPSALQRPAHQTQVLSASCPAPLTLPVKAEEVGGPFMSLEVVTLILGSSQPVPLTQVCVKWVGHRADSNSPILQLVQLKPRG